MKVSDLFRVFFSVVVASMATSAASQNYPVRAIRIIVPFAPGGGTDIVARAFAPRLSEALGQQVVIDNRPGAGTIIGAELAARSAPDGYTLFMGITGTMAINPSMYRKLPYDPVKDFAPVMLTAHGPNVLVVHPSLPVKTVKDLIALAKSKPGALAYGSSGIGQAPHLAGELFKAMAGVDMIHVPYKGAAPVTVDLLAGQVQLMFAGLGAAMPYIKSNRIRPVAVASLQRSPALPDVPAIAETLKGFEAATWFAVFTPAGVSRDVIGRLNSEIAKVLARPEVVKQLSDLGYEPLTSTPEHLGQYVRTEIDKWARVIRSAGIQPE